MTGVDRTSRDVVIEKIVAIIREVLPRETSAISTATKPTDVPGWDSIAHVQIIVRVERAFAIRIRATELAQLGNVGALVDLVVARCPP